MTPPDEASGAEPPADKAAKTKSENNKATSPSKKSDSNGNAKQSRAKKPAAKKSDDPAPAKKSDDKPAAAKPKAASSVPAAGSKSEAQDDDKTAPDTKALPPHKPKRSPAEFPGGAVGVTLLVLAAGALGGIIATLFGGSSPTDEELAAADPIVAARVSELQSKIDGLESQASEAQTRADSLESSLDELRTNELNETVALVGELDGRVEGLEQSLANIVSVPMEEGTPIGPAMLSELTTGLGDVRQTLTQLDQQLSGRVSALEATAPPPNLDQILRGLTPRDELSTLASRVSSLEDDRTGSDAKRAALALALANLSRAAETGAPFDAELEAVAILAPGQSAIRTLRESAATGLPTRTELQTNFEAVIDGVLEGERVAEADGWFAQLWAWLSSFVTVRQTGDIEGTNTEAILARAEFNLDDGNLQGAAAELAQLDGPSVEAVANWKRGLDAHIALDDLVGTLTTQVLKSLGQ